MRDTFQEIWSTLRQNKLRTALTGFAVSWGIFIIIILIGSGNGLVNAFSESSSGEVHNIVNVWTGQTSKAYKGTPAGTQMKIGREDLAYTERSFEPVKAAYGMLNFSGTIKLNGNTKSLSITGISPDDLDSQGNATLAGRQINENDMRERRKVLYIDSKTAASLLDDGDPREIVGKTVAIDDIAFKVVGVYEANSEMMNNDNYAPYTTIETMRGVGDDMWGMTASFEGMETKEQNEAFNEKLRTGLNILHNAAPDDKRTFYIDNEVLNNIQMSKAQRILNTALWILGFFSLISGIVGVSNIMLISVKERTHEFGIRKALGATPASVLKLIVIESVAITAFFGFIGIIMGMGGNELLDSTLGARAIDIGIQQIHMFKDIRIGMDVALKAMLLLIVSGTLAGIAPAWKAARVRPIEALSSDR